MMDFYEVLDQVIDLLEQRGRMSYRALKRQFDLDDDYIEDLKEELIHSQRLAVDEDGRVLIWTGETGAVDPLPDVWHKGLLFDGGAYIGSRLRTRRELGRRGGESFLVRGPGRACLFRRHPGRSYSVELSAPPLDGIRVLDFTHVLAGPFCTRLLADLGADVVRVESSKHPDHPWPSKYEHADGRHASYLNTNRSKRSITIDLKHEAGRELAVRLAAVADVVTENFSASVMSRLGLDYETLESLNPRLVYASMSGYGHSGPRRDWTSMNMNLQGYGGLMLATGSEDDPPTAISNSWNDYIGGLHTCFGIIEALTERERTGSGVYLDLSQFECSVAMIAPLLLSAAVNQTNPRRLGNRSTRFAPQGVYRCAGEDEWCAISVQTDEQWRSLAAAMADSSFSADPRFATVLGRMRHHDEIDRAIEVWTRRCPNIEIEQRLRRMSIPAERMRRIQEVVEAPDRSQAFRPMQEPRVTSMLTTVLPLHLSSSPVAPARPAPSVGEHTREVLREWLELSDAQMTELNRQEVLV